MATEANEIICQKLAIVIDSFYSNVKRLSDDDKKPFIVKTLDKTIIPRFKKNMGMISNAIFSGLWDSDAAAESIIDRLLHDKEHYEWHVSKYGAESFVSSTTYWEYINDVSSNAKGQSFYRERLVSCIRDNNASNFRQALYHLFVRHVTHLDVLLSEMEKLHDELCTLAPSNGLLEIYLPNMFAALSDESHEYRGECKRILTIYGLEL